MSDPAKAIAHLLAVEGGWCIDDGGPTNFGWTLPALAAVDVALTAEQLRAMTQGQAADLYRRYYWNGFGAIDDQTVATKILDMTVNMEGPSGVAHGQAVKLVQRALCAIGVTVDTDGIWGPETVEAINGCTPALLLTAIISTQSKFYRALAAQDPVRYGPNLSNWLKRAAWPGAGS